MGEKLSVSRRLLEEVSSKLQGQKKPMLAELDPLETADMKDLDKDWYERKMRKNVETLAKAVKDYHDQK